MLYDLCSLHNEETQLKDCYSSIPLSFIFIQAALQLVAGLLKAI